MEQHQVSVTEFKAHCLEWLSRVQSEGLEVTLTKRGKRIARIAPCREDLETPVILGCMAGTIEIRGDILEPMDVQWNAFLE